MDGLSRNRFRAFVLLTLWLVASLAAQAGEPVRVLVLTAFPPELAPWLEHMPEAEPIDIDGAYAPVWCDSRRVCVTETGIGEVNTATSMAALLASDKLDLGQTFFLRAGIAGGPPDGANTLGGAVWSDWVVSWDLGHHLSATSHGQSQPIYRPLSPTEPAIDTHAFQLNPKLLALAQKASQNTELADDPSARADRKKYPGQEQRQPTITVGATISGDDYWSGQALSELAGRIVARYSDHASHYASTAMEETGDAGALLRRGLLSRYASVRTISDFDQPPAEQTAHAMLAAGQYPGGQIAITNAYRVAHAVVDYALSHPKALAQAMAADPVKRQAYPLSASAARGS
ncbi:hypothetical protein V5738_01175 [Salinisphaera sp. SPP-AMP-43]|uniref:phosphorylase family protein n=1 Tax=Salinisphaera sp. SPP-AMP-43 TaxID=3121288 RepID=UPI003C6DCA2C